MASDPRFLDAGKVWTNDGRLVPIPPGGSDPNAAYHGTRISDVGGPTRVFGVGGAPTGKASAKLRK